jgi:sulfite reductase (ferredoxin)
MLLAARALLRSRNLDAGQDPDRIVAAFKLHFYDTEIFFDKYAKGKFAQYFFNRHAAVPTEFTKATGYRQIEEARLFLEACHECEARVNGAVFNLGIG